MAGLELAERLSSMSKFRSFLTHQRLPWVLAAVGMVLTLPSLFTGWAMDDHVLRYASAGGEGISSELHKPTGLFGFLGDPEIVQSLKERKLYTILAKPACGPIPTLGATSSRP